MIYGLRKMMKMAGINFLRSGTARAAVEICPPVPVPGITANPRCASTGWTRVSRYAASYRAAGIA